MTRARVPHVVMVSWKGPRHPGAGGAELYTERALAGLARRGMHVTWLVPRVDGLPEADERPDGVRIRRLGGRWTHPLAALAYLRRQRTSIDLVIDQINTYPMGTRLIVPAPRSLVLIHQLARELWFLEAPWPLALPGWLLEPVWLWLYRHRRAVTVSDSTARDLRRLGFRGVSVVPVSVVLPVPPQHRCPPDPPLFVALGRLVRMKRFEHALRAFELFRRERPDARFVLIGRGDTSYARQLAARAGRIPGVRVLRDASEEDKAHLLATATALVATSLREGWGIMVTEAHAWGTPTVAYRVPGLRDSTHDGRDGLLTPPRPDALAAAMRRVASDSTLWQVLSRGARADGERHTDRELEAGFAEVVECCLASGRG